MANFEISFLLNGKTFKIVVKDVVTFYQEKKDELNIISVNKTDLAITPEISLFLKAKRSIFENLEI